MASEDIELMDNGEWHATLERELSRDAKDPTRAAERAAVQAKTESEVERGMMHGPFTKDQLDAAYGAGKWRAMRRFGVWTVDEHGKWKCRCRGRAW